MGDGAAERAEHIYRRNKWYNVALDLRTNIAIQYSQPTINAIRAPRKMIFALYIVANQHLLVLPSPQTKKIFFSHRVNVMIIY